MDNIMAPSIPCTVLLKTPATTTLMWAILEYATKHLKSVCRSVVNELYTSVTTAIVCTNGLKYEVASGNRGIKIRRKP